MRRSTTAVENYAYNVLISATTMAKAPIAMETLTIPKAVFERVTLAERENIGIFEPKRIPAELIKERARAAMTKLGNGTASQLISGIKSRMAFSHSYLYEITEKYQDSFHDFMVERKSKPIPQVRFKNVQEEHIEYLE